MNYRCHQFPTAKRKETTVICVRDTLTKPSVKADLAYMDALHARQGRLGFGGHYLVDRDGLMYTGRDIETYGSHTRAKDYCSVAIYLEGGIDEDGNRLHHRTDKQLVVLMELIESTWRYFQANLPVDDQYPEVYPTS